MLQRILSLAADRGAVTNARRAMLHDAQLHEQRQRLAPGTTRGRLDEPGQTLQVIEPEQCWELLDGQPIGRLSFTAHSGVPVIVLVNYVVDRKTIVLRSGRGPKHSAAARGEVVAFEADDIDKVSRSGWSVVVVGDARLVTDPGERRRLSVLGLQPWASGPRDDYIVITPRNVAGRWLRAATCQTQIRP